MAKLKGTSVEEVTDVGKFYQVTFRSEVIEPQTFFNLQVLHLGPLGLKGYCLPLRVPSPPPPHTLFWLLHQHGVHNRLNSYKHSTPPGNFFPKVKVIGQDQRLRSKI